MAVPKLSKEAQERLLSYSKSKKMTPSQVVLPLLPEPDPAEAAFDRLLSRKPAKESDWVINQIAVEAVNRVRKSRKSE
ncbi:MAG TPA: hypothetical protein VFS50_16415 [Meiothermus sp.]|nr:hypothetical protein [Meiothermus sp.]